MYLSRIPLNPARRDTAKLITSPHATHGAVMKSFPPEALEQHTGDGRVLWRMDRVGHAIHLYVVSPIEPDFTHVVEQAGWPTTTAWVTRKYGELLDILQPGQSWHFRLTANPVRGVPKPFPTSTAAQGATVGKGRGAPRGLNSAQQLDWFHRQASRYGFITCECGPNDDRQPDVAIVDRHTARFRRGNGTANNVTLSMATFEGTLIVTDATLLKSALINGIGRGKGYGCGLLTLAAVG
ncbi:type I-E CRISPR-associated protein Cas6/Cse3/CasE [Nocardia veterana]|uniref:Type I-E CRISPR-associated protein Cas6/Cse3/CasE n=2 Tax=Nocardia veterana TaxID=132249 RepID=A0A7X6M090_9NOCA|nr:type I-E CRISPR-associated protein Cas6/Cse3/CasE [Nocardia veterana]